MDIVAVEVTPSVWAGISRNVIVGGGTISDGDEYWTHPEHVTKKMIIPARIIQEINEFMESLFIERH
jgi:hypothetical protein